MCMGHEEVCLGCDFYYDAALGFDSFFLTSEWVDVTDLTDCSGPVVYKSLRRSRSCSSHTAFRVDSRKHPAEQIQASIVVRVVGEK